MCLAHVRPWMLVPESKLQMFGILEHMSQGISQNNVSLLSMSL